MEMLEKVALITGATRGIGKGIATTLQQDGFKVAITGRNQTLLDEWSQYGALAIKADVSVPDQVNDLIGQIMQEWGRIDVVVNNAGITRDGLVMRMSDQDWNEVLATNLTGVFNVCRAVSRPMMRQRAGKIVNISSIVGVIGNPGQTNYAASKAGVIGFSKSLARELASRNILVNVVAPGYIDTAMTQALEPSQKEALLAQIPLKQTGTVDDVANLVSFLVSEQNQYITGQTIHCDGGLAL